MCLSSVLRKPGEAAVSHYGLFGREVRGGQHREGRHALAHDGVGLGARERLDETCERVEQARVLLVNELNARFELQGPLQVDRPLWVQAATNPVEDPRRTFALALACVHRGIGGDQQRVQVAAVVRKNRQTEARTHRKRARPMTTGSLMAR